MSVSPSNLHGAPSLTFAKPTNPVVDGEFLKALEHADDDQPTEAEPAKPVAKGTRVDVRA
jgi:hypothetical protein